MTILLIKADQMHLFEKLVPVKGHVTNAGVVVAAHTAIRHVANHAPAAPKVHHPEVQDLFDRPAAAAEPVKAVEPRSDAVFRFQKGDDVAMGDREGVALQFKRWTGQYQVRFDDGVTEWVDADGLTAASDRAKRSEAAANALAERNRKVRAQPVAAPRRVGNEPETKPGSVAETPAETAPKPGLEPETAPVQAEAPAAPVIALFLGLDYSGPDLPTAPTFGVLPGTSKAQRREINARAAAMVGQKATLFDAPAEKPDPLVLAQYSGFGGCGDSLNEFYTEPAVAVAMWDVLHKLGVGEGANVLEPSCATGVFLAAAPKGVKVTGIELDGCSALIGATLHPAHEVVHSSLERFATSDTRQFDAVIGNAPFGTRGACQIQDKRDLSLHEAYFMDTSLDKAKPGGVVAMIVNTTLLNSKNMRKVRERLLRKGEFLGAMRMPNTAFEAAHTDVTSDILFFRKRPDDVAGALSVVDQDTLKLLGVWDEEYLAGAYFEGRGESNVLGEVGTAMRAFGEIYTVNGSMAGVPEAIAGFKPDSVSGGPSSVADVLKAAPKALADRIRGAAATKAYDLAKRGDVKVIDGVRYILEGEPLRWHRVDEFAAQAAVIDAMPLATEIERALADDGYAAASGLADKVKAYVEAHGVPSKNLNLQIAAKTDKVLYRLIGAVKPDGSLSDLVHGQVSIVQSSFDAAAQTLALELGTFTPSMVVGRWHEGTEESALDHLYASTEYALDPATGMWTTLDNYLTGELWPKLDAVKAALGEGGDPKPEDRAKYQRQAEALEETIGAKALEDVEVQLNSAFLPLNVVAAFFNETKKHSWMKVDMALTFDEGVYAAVGDNYDKNLLLKYLNRAGVRKEDDLPTIEKWNEEFKEWLCASSYRDEVEELYNRTFRGFRQKEYSDKPFDVPGLRSEGLKSYQWSGLRWALEAGKGIIAADVGLGKTARALILNKLLKATGRAKKPLIIVPKSVAANWMREAEKWFPGSSVLVIGETYTKDKKTGELKGRADTAAERDAKLHDLTQNDYDFVLISQPAWNDIDLDPETRDRLQADDFWEQRKKSLEGASEKQRNKARDSWDSAKVKEQFERRTGAIYFNDLGVDALISDEMHAYKNLFEAKNRFGQSPKFLGGSGSSKRAADMRYKAAWLREQTSGMNVYGLTATPTKNSPLEVYSMLSHIAPEAFERIGIRNSEEFLDRFCVFEERNVLSTTGEMTRALCTVGFKNLDELREIMRRYIDRKTAEDVGLQLPTADQREHLLDMSAEQKEVYAELREMAEQAAINKDATGEGHIFSIMAKMAKASLDLELYDPVKYAGATSPKIAGLAARVKEGIGQGGQIIFCDHIEAHEKLVNAMVDAGIPRAQIGIINAQVAPTSAKRQNIAEAYRAGKLRAVVGNTATMGEGVDGLQADTTDIHHMDWPWEPSTLQQRNGRGRRQGNTAESIRIHSYLGKGTFDGYRYQTVMAKRDWMDALWNGGDRIENMAMAGQLGRDDMLVMLSEDPEAARKKLEENKSAAQAKLDADSYGKAAEEFASFRAKKATLAKMKAADRQKTSGVRLGVAVERMRTALEANPYFKAKHALDATHDVLLQPQSGHAFEPGGSFKAGEGSEVDQGHYVVEGVYPTHGLVNVRRWGTTGREGKLSFELDKLAHGIEPVEHDAAAEDAHAAEATKAALASGVTKLTHMKQVKEMGSAAIEANYPALQARIKEGMRGYTFSHEYGPIGMVPPGGGPAEAPESYDAPDMLNTHDVMLPTDAHRALAFDAFHEDEKAAKSIPDYTAKRNRYDPIKNVLRYPGRQDQQHNRWRNVIENLWGKDTAKAAREESNRRSLEAARRAPSYAEARTHAERSARGEYGSASPKWSRRALATLYVKAKQHGVLDENGANLTAMAQEHGHHDLAAVMAVDSAKTPQDAAAALAKMDLMQPAVKDALRHLVEKHPDVADFPAKRSYSGGFQTVAELLGGPDERRAA